MCDSHTKKTQKKHKKTCAFQKNTQKNMRIRMRIMRMTRKILCVFLNAHIFLLFFLMRKILCFSLRKNTKKYAHDNLCFLHNLRMMRILYLCDTIILFFFMSILNQKKENSFQDDTKPQCT